MSALRELIEDKNLQNKLSSFLDQYGVIDLENALKNYTDLQQEYIFKTKDSVFKLRIVDVDYIKIQGHHMAVHAQNNIFPNLVHSLRN